jgi:hypothetical protein
MRCPTCRAVQPWSETCRRCKSDLRLLRAFADTYEHSRRACLAAIRDGNASAASFHAQQCHSLEPASPSRQLLAVAAILRRDWLTATALAAREMESRNGH